MQQELTQDQLTQDQLTQDQAPAQERYFWSIFQIIIASYIGGPLAGTYLLGRNYQNAELPATAKKCYLWGIIGTILLYVIIFLVPESSIIWLPSTLIPIAYVAVIITFAGHQKKMIHEEFGKDNKRYSHFRCLGLSLSFFLIQMVFVFLLAFLYAMLES